LRTTREETIREYRRHGWWSDRRIFDLFDAAVQAVPDQLALFDPPNRAALIGSEPRRLTYAEAAGLVDGYASRLLEFGLRHDDVLVTQLPNVVEYPALYLAAWRVGVVVSPVPMQFRRHEIEQIIDLTGARSVLTVREMKGVPYAAPIRDLLTSRGTQVYVLDEDAPQGTLPFTPVTMSKAMRTRLDQHVASSGVDADDIATICWTSGTEGKPKGVPRSHNHWISISHGHWRGTGIQRGERLLNPFPLINMAAIGGCFMSWLHSAGTLVLHHPLDLAVYLRQIATERPQ
jgi:acyl-CoA synthetase (AMP-forming)/AMP-acid ligase II